jgi:hypothetical protein
MHEHVVKHLLELCAMLNVYAQNAPKGYHTVDAAGKQIDNKQPDGLIELPHPVLFDVRGVDPISPVAVQLNVNNDRAAADLAAKAKCAKYDAIAKAKHVQFQPFVFETLGGLHASAVDLIEMILKNCRHPNKKALRYTKLAEMSMAIMRDNARLVQDSHRRA